MKKKLKAVLRRFTNENQKRNIITRGIAFGVVCLICCSFLVLLTAQANGQNLVLAANGITLTIQLPPNCTLDLQTNSSHSISYIGNTQVVLKISKTSVAKELRFEREIYHSLLQNAPDTTFFEELPTFNTGKADFTVCRLIYNSQNDSQTTYLKAFCKLNYRYTYVIELRTADAIDADMLHQFTNYTITKTPLVFDRPVLVLLLFYIVSGGVIMFHSFSKKHCRMKATGVIAGFEFQTRSVSVFVLYHTKSGAAAIGAHHLLRISALPFINKQGQAVEISYSEKKPQNVHIISSKSEYMTGLLFIILAVSLALLMIFV